MKEGELRCEPTWQVRAQVQTLAHHPVTAMPQGGVVLPGGVAVGVSTPGVSVETPPLGPDSQLKDPQSPLANNFCGCYFFKNQKGFL